MTEISFVLLDKISASIALNAVMYIHSLNPDVTHLKPASQQTANERKATLRSGFDLNNSYFPLVYVSWNYGKDVIYSKESTIVKSHLRWQPCGPGRGDTKLIIIKEHERTFKHVKPDVIVNKECNMKNHKRARTNEEFGLEVKSFPKNKQWAVDQGYVSKLTEAEKAWLGQFNQEFYRGTVNQNDPKTLHNYP